MGAGALERAAQRLHLRHHHLQMLLLLLLSCVFLPSNSLPTSSHSSGPGPFAGPARPDARVGIVGAGPAGLHMAYLMRSLGFENLLVLEASSRVGGRSVSWPDELQPGVIHELGTCYLSSDYRDLRIMAGHIGHDLDEVPLPTAVLRQPDSSKQVTLEAFLFNRARQQDPGLGKDATEAAVRSRIIEATKRYLEIRAQIFPTNQSDFLEFPMSQPSQEALARVNCTLSKFLADNNLLSLEPFFLVGMTSMGYGSARDTSALYGLMWMSQAYLMDIQNPRNSSSRLAMLRRGFQSLWDATREHLERRGGVEFRLSSSVSRVTRSESGVRLQLASGESEALDWLIWTPGVHRTAAAAFADLSPAEAAAFAGLSARKFRTRLVRLTGDSAAESRVAADSTAYYLDALDGQPGLNRLLAVRNSARILLGQDIPSRPSTMVAYYLSDYGADVGNDISVEDNADNRLLDSGETLLDLTFDYMPRFSVSDMAGGALWRALSSEVQGANRTWFAGHSLVFDSVKSVMRYNKMLLLAAFPEEAKRLAEI